MGHDSWRPFNEGRPGVRPDHHLQSAGGDRTAGQCEPGRQQGQPAGAEHRPRPPVRAQRPLRTDQRHHARPRGRHRPRRLRIHRDRRRARVGEERLPEEAVRGRDRSRRPGCRRRPDLDGGVGRVGPVGDPGGHRRYRRPGSVAGPAAVVRSSSRVPHHPDVPDPAAQRLPDVGAGGAAVRRPRPGVPQRSTRSAGSGSSCHTCSTAASFPGRRRWRG